ncbi:MAG: selenium-binding protein SBP56-related protein [Candidatus Palauibacterales bacterium]|nr:selenium-binding protein SBP56-related protein [Candidatus Palauibacterales bacterium]
MVTAARKCLHVLTLAFLLPFALSCAPGDREAPDANGPPKETASAASPYLFVWAGAVNDGDSDFLAVIDADPESARYGEILSSLSVGLKGGAHHTEHVMPAGDTLFANAFQAGTTFLFDISDPLDPKVAGSFEAMGEYTYPHTFERLPNGDVLATFQTMGEGNEVAGGLVELDPSGGFVRSSAAADPVDPELRAYSVTPIPKLDRAVSTTSDMWEEHISTSFQAWRLSDLALLHTVRLPEGPLGYEHEDPAEVRLLPDSVTAILTTFTCAMYLLHDLETDEPWAELVHVLPWDAYPNHCGVPATRGRYWVQPYARGDSSALISMDISDPSNPVELDRLTLDESWAPHWISMEPEGDRIVVTSAEGSTLYRVLIVHLDPETGSLALDSTFRSPGAERPGVSFDRTEWPHGEAGPARPHGTVFSRRH